MPMPIREIAERCVELATQLTEADLTAEEHTELGMGTVMLASHVIATEDAETGTAIAISPEKFAQIQLLQVRWDTLLAMMGADFEKMEKEIDLQIARNTILVPKGVIV